MYFLQGGFLDRTPGWYCQLLAITKNDDMKLWN
jgi:hypothetical protein